MIYRNTVMPCQLSNVREMHVRAFLLNTRLNKKLNMDLGTEQEGRK